LRGEDGHLDQHVELVAAETVRTGEACRQLVAPSGFHPDGSGFIHESLELGGDRTHIGRRTENRRVAFFQLGPWHVMGDVDRKDLGARLCNAAHNGIGDDLRVSVKFRVIANGNFGHGILSNSSRMWRWSAGLLAAMTRSSLTKPIGAPESWVILPPAFSMIGTKGAMS